MTLPAADVTNGWTYALYQDVNGNGVLDSSDTLITNGAVPAATPGNPVYLLVKVFAPGGAAAGATNVATVAVTFPAGSTNCGTPSAQDTTTVVLGQVRMIMTQATNSACNAAGMTTALGALGTAVISAKPGECVVYQVTATNQGTSTVSNLNLSNAIPAYTTLDTSQAPTCASTGISPAFTNPTGLTNASTAVTCGNGTTATTVQPGGTATLTFQVKLNTN
ncbi:hypothetical protein [uncultured Pseudacidovorax sp.]|uniref:hypothetical protein n=1 Tax=uncultured Pseudacidovorax sp. TaxID=679313 RepID=UPI0025ECBDB2|nr:hypothetical protein [uncultured Pseudacidovorax sp.]